MGDLRRYVVSALTVAVVAVPLPGSASTELAKPYERASVSAVCGIAPAQKCDVDVAAHNNGSLLVAVDPTTPGGGGLPGVTHERGFASVWSTPEVTQPTDAIAVVATLKIHHAEAAGEGFLTGAANARTGVFLDIRHLGCACIAHIERTIVVGGGPDVDDAIVTISTILEMPTGMPAGELRIEAGVRASASVTDFGLIPQPGTSTAAISATVDSISFSS